MVCTKCQRKLKKTELATPAVKRKNDMYYGSSSSTVGGGGDAKSKSSSATLGNTGISKVCHVRFIPGAPLEGPTSFQCTPYGTPMSPHHHFTRFLPSWANPMCLLALWYLGFSMAECCQHYDAGLCRCLSLIQSNDTCSHTSL